MRKFLFALPVWLMLSPFASAQCAGHDLRETLTSAERDRLDALLAEMPYPAGNHWRAEKDGEVIPLVGTMHLSDPRLEAPLERLRPVVRDAGALLLEMPRAQEKQLQAAVTTQPDLLFLSDATLPELMDEEDWQALSKAAKAHGIPPFMAAKFRPWYLSMMLSMPACAQEALQEQNGFDKQLETVAENMGVPTVALEPYDAAFAIFNAEPVEDQIEMMTASLAAEKQGEDSFATTIAAYFDEEAGEMWHMAQILLERQDTFTAEEAAEVMEESGEALLAQRNRAWIPVILKTADKAGKPIVAAFGAAHLPGEEGVLNLLAEEGFTLTREPF